MGDLPFILLRTGKHLRVILPISVSRDLGANLSDPLERESSFVESVPVVRRSRLCPIRLFPLVGLPSEKIGQFGIHHLRKISSDHLSHVQANHLEDLFWVLLNFLENADNFGDTDLDLHGRFSFL